MKATSEITEVVTLVLNFEEAEWLQTYMQNAFVEDEDNVTRRVREQLFNALKNRKLS